MICFEQGIRSLFTEMRMAAHIFHQRMSCFLSLLIRSSKLFFYQIQTPTHPSLISFDYMNTNYYDAPTSDPAKYIPHPPL